jgi:hypothetical protein
MVKTLRIHGQNVECFSLIEIARRSKRKVSTLRDWERKDWLPVSPFRSPDIKLKNGEVRPGARVYPKDAAIMMASIISQVDPKLKRKMDSEVVRKLFLIMQETVQKYTDAANAKEKTNSTA